MLKFMVCNGFGCQLNNRWLLTTRIIAKGEEELDDGSISPSRRVAPYFGESSLTYEYNSLSGSLILGTKSHSQMAVTEQIELYALDAEV